MNGDLGEIGVHGSEKEETFGAEKHPVEFMKSLITASDMEGGDKTG